MIERSARSRMADATLPKDRVAPARELTPITIRLCDPVLSRRSMASSGAVVRRIAVRTGTPLRLSELDDLAKDRLGAAGPGGAELPGPGLPARHPDIQRGHRAVVGPR